MNHSMTLKRAAMAVLSAVALLPQTASATTPRLDQVGVTGRYTGGATVLCQGL
jgi:hypothetical protein